MNELKHYGVLGMKWGIRRYQPYSVKPRESGKTGKEIGKARQYAQRAKDIAVKLNTKSIKTKKDSEPISPLTATTKELRNISNSASDIARRGQKNRPIGDYSKMSDQELRNAINRLTMEENYDRLLNNRNYERSGRETLIDVLDTTGDVLAIGTSAAILASIIYQLGK